MVRVVQAQKNDRRYCFAMGTLSLHMSSSPMPLHPCHMSVLFTVTQVFYSRLVLSGQYSNLLACAEDSTQSRRLRQVITQCAM